MDRENCEWT